MSHALKGSIRSVKNVAKGYTDIQVKVREATSNDPGPVNSDLMRQIAEASNFDQQFVEIMIIMEKRLNDDGRNWRHVYKALVLLEFMILCGSDRVIQYARDNLFVVKTLREFQFRDEAGVDHGVNVRQKANKITDLCSNEELLRQERAARRTVDDRVTGRADYYAGRESAYAAGGGSGMGSGRAPAAAGVGSGGADPGSVAAQREEEDLRRAIEESMRSAERERTTRAGYSGSLGRSHSVPRSAPASMAPPAAARAPSGGGGGGEMSEEEQIQRAIEMSKRDEEERQRRRGILPPSSSSGASRPPQQTSAPLIDLLGGVEQPIMATGGGPGSMQYMSTQPTGMTDPFAMAPGNPFTQLAAQPTGYTAMSSQPTGFSADPFAPSMPSAMGMQPTGMMGMQSTGYGGGGGMMQPMATGNPFGGGPAGGSAASGPAGFNPFGGSAAGSTFTPPFGGPLRPSSTPPATSKPMVDLDNIGPPNRNPFATTTTSTGTAAGATGNAGAFNWTGATEAPKLTLAEITAQRQAQGSPFAPQMTGGMPMYGGGAPAPFGAQMTGPAAYGGAAAANPFGMMGQVPTAQTGMPYGQQQQQQQQGQQQNPFF
ncbi:hypothetical protein BC828DRAFT_374722 [Blastocladiella britannica]|nr:hypothetical protein BC828DRAFT_374722 [Blastocladiella britannica]